MRKRITAVLVGILLIGIVSAGLVPWLSNMVSGSVNVEGPVFYLDKTDIIGDGKYSLKLNNDSVSGTYFKLDSQEFFSQELGINRFYPQDFKVYLNTKVYGLNESETASIFVAVFIARNDGSVKEILCSNLRIGISEEDVYELNCIVGGNGMDNMDETDRLKLLINDGSPSEDYMRIYLENSKIEIIPAWNKKY